MFLILQVKAISSSNYKIICNQDSLLYTHSQIESLNKRVLHLMNEKQINDSIENNEVCVCHIFKFSYPEKPLASDFLSGNFINKIEVSSLRYPIGEIDYIPSEVIISNRDNKLIGLAESDYFILSSNYNPGLHQFEQHLLDKIKEWDIKYLMYIDAFPNIPIFAITDDEHTFVFNIYKREISVMTIKEYIISHKKYFIMDIDL